MPVSSIGPEDICFVIAHYRTPDLLRGAVESLFAHVPYARLHIVDNGATEETIEAVDDLIDEYPGMDAEFVKENLGHGPAMHRVIVRAEHPAYFFLDSDTVVRSGSFLEPMLELLSGDDVYGVGRVIGMSKRGYFVDSSEAPVTALDPAYMLIRTEYYGGLAPFAQHGAPCLQNFASAERSGRRLQDFPIGEHIDHLHRGTVDRHGYGLGLKGKINHLLEKLGL